CVLTSLFFCFMHFQYYNVLDQIVLFVVSVLLLMVRIKSQTPLYPMLMHSGMNAFVILLNIKITL
ncbi:CPBP family glutamic-type intramembrane protease, partial [Klebsiella variicola]